MIITSLTTAPPETGVDCMRGHRRHPSSTVTCLLSRVWIAFVATALWAVRIRPDNAQDQTGHKPVATARLKTIQRRKIENSEKSKLRMMLRTTQVTMGK